LIVTLDELNRLPYDEAVEVLRTCCGSSAWLTAMEKRRPFCTAGELCRAADDIWRNLSPRDWKEAFSHHPKIGDREGLRRRFALTRTWAEGEQSGVQTASEQVLQNLADGNRRYEERFGYIFIICATGKRAEEMLEALNDRLSNAPDVELGIASEEQRKITQVRLGKLIGIL
jgi:2-oxo-4-hydroxy-4-carboxy-5-ureidoimidazoline decarboxylase